MGTALTERLQSLTAEELLEMEQMLTDRGAAHVLARWDLILDQIRYVLTL